MSPIDPQYQDQSGSHSVNAMIRMFDKLKDVFSEIHEQDAPYPLKSLADDINPVELQERIDTAKMMRQHAKTILTKHDDINDSEAEVILKELMSEYPTHNYCITFSEVQEILPDRMIVHERQKEEEMEVMRVWLHQYLDQQIMPTKLNTVLGKRIIVVKMKGNSKVMQGEVEYQLFGTTKSPKEQLEDALEMFSDN
jgi:hypothetical protein